MPFVRELRSYGYCILAYLDDVLVAPSPYGVVATGPHCQRTRTVIPKTDVQAWNYLANEQGRVGKGNSRRTSRSDRRFGLDEVLRGSS